jgi:hypothetical protein
LLVRFMDPHDHRTSVAIAATDLPWSLAIVLAVSIGLLFAGTLLLLLG